MIINMPRVKNNCFAISVEKTLHLVGMVHLFKVIIKMLIVREGDNVKIDLEIDPFIISICENA